MTKASVALKQYLSKIGFEGDVDFLRESIQLMKQMLIELEVEEQIGAEKHERTPERSNHRNGYRQRQWETRVGEIGLQIPKLRKGSFFPSLLEPRRRTENALLAVVQQAYIEGVSTRKVDNLLKALGLTGIDKSKVSRICKELDEVVEQFRNRPLEGEYPYLWLDALYLKVRQTLGLSDQGQDHRIVSVIATGVDTEGRSSHPGICAGSQRRERILVGLPAFPGRAWFEGRAIGYQRRTRRLESGHQPDLDRSRLVALPGALHA